MTLPRQEHRLARRRPARGVENGAAQLFQSCAGLGGYRDGAGVWSKLGMQVHLVIDVDAGGPLGQWCLDRFVRASLVHCEYDVRELQLEVRARHPEPLELIGRSAQTGCVYEDERDAVYMDRLTQRVARRSRYGGDDRTVFAGEPIEQARLAHVRATDQHHMQPAS